MKALFFFIPFSCWLMACQPELQPLGNGQASPIACHIVGELDGQPLRFEAGIHGQFLHTDLQPNVLQIFETSSAIKPDPCEGCASHLEITISDFQRNNGGSPMNPDSIFQIKNYPFQIGGIGSTSRLISLTQNNLDGLTPIQNNWSVLTLTNELVAQSNEMQANFLIPPGAYNTRLISTFSNGCTDTSTNPIVIDSSFESGAPCSAEISITRLPSSTSILLDTFNVQVPNPLQVVWRVAGMVFTGGSLFLMTDSFILNNVFEVELEIFSLSCTAKVVQRIAKNPTLNCATSFRVGNMQSVDPLQLGHVRLKWTDAQGHVFGSEMEKQPTWANFEVTALDTFPNNRAGLPTILLTGRVNCRLYRVGGAFNDLRNVSFKMAFPYKP